jgi:multisubunit Na+/H+ antiporter MnhB subunit
VSITAGSTVLIVLLTQHELQNFHQHCTLNETVKLKVAIGALWLSTINLNDGQQAKHSVQFYQQHQVFYTQL